MKITWLVLHNIQAFSIFHFFAIVRVTIIFKLWQEIYTTNLSSYLNILWQKFVNNQQIVVRM